MISALDRKLLRDFARLWAQGLAIAMVLAAGVATLVLSMGVYQSLDETLEAYYQRYRFGHIFASATRAPRSLLDQISSIEGVAATSARVAGLGLLDLPGIQQPASAMLLGMPESSSGNEGLNRLYIRAGQLPDPSQRNQVAVNEAFAKAHQIDPGDRIQVVLSGQQVELRIVAVVLSPETIYTIGPGDLIPDDRRYGVFWMPDREVQALFDREGAFNQLIVQLQHGAVEDRVIERIDALLKPYGGSSAYGRDMHPSHAFIDAELTELKGLMVVLPPVFLLVTAFLVNMILNRLIALEREQVGLLKAVGYGRWVIAGHYFKLVLLIALVGIVIGAIAGGWLGYGLTVLFGRFYHFPFLIFHLSPEVFLIAALVAFIAALGGAMGAVTKVLRLQPVAAMSPPAPPSFRGLPSLPLGLGKFFSQSTIMVARHLLRTPVRSILTMIGISFSVSVMIMSMFAIDSIDHMIDVVFHQSERQHATISFQEAKPYSAVDSIRHLPGIMRVEPYRSVSARISHNNLSRKVGVLGKPADGDLSRILDLDLNPVKLPPFGIALSRKLAQILEVRPGEKVWLEILGSEQGLHQITVTSIIQGYIGLSAYMSLADLNRMIGEDRLVSGVNISLDENQTNDFYRAVKETPSIYAISLLRRSLEQFRNTIGQNISIMVTVFSSLGMVIAFGVCYNSARVQLSERARELASLRVLGFTRGEVSRILLSEIGFLAITAIPVGWLLGYWLAWLAAQGMQSELYQIPFLVEPATYARATMVVLVAIIISGAIVWRRIQNLDLIKVLKTRE